MSEFSGKCDLCDTLDIYGDSMNPNNTTIYVGDIGPLKYTCNEDLIPYYPYITSIMTSSQESIYIRLAPESFVDSEEKERISYIFDEVIKLFNKAKREKKTFNFDYVEEKLGADWFYSRDYKNLYREIVERVLKDGKKADVSDIHTSMHNFYRKALCEVAKKNKMEYHPIISNVRRKLLEYDNFIAKYKDVK